MQWRKLSKWSVHLFHYIPSSFHIPMSHSCVPFTQPFVFSLKNLSVVMDAALPKYKYLLKPFVLLQVCLQRPPHLVWRQHLVLEFLRRFLERERDEHHRKLGGSSLGPLSVRWFPRTPTCQHAQTRNAELSFYVMSSLSKPFGNFLVVSEGCRRGEVYHGSRNAERLVA